ncbi:hypothetical protein [Aeromicrobium sp. UC242_57]|uniref:hypothetical protein n=1 Tax=Aeromicrobium sp. UC242_57 TaxID=3374624 RepID=UPI00379D1D25
MNTTTSHRVGIHGSQRHTDSQADRRRAGAFWALLTTAGSFGVGAWALAAASGVTRLTDTDYDTEFLDSGITLLVYPLLVLVFLATRKHVLAGLVATVGLVAGQTWAMTVCVNRYADSGWSDGLEVLGYILPISLGLFGLVIVLATWLAHRPRFRA